MDAIERKMLAKKARRNEVKIPELMYSQIYEYMKALDGDSHIQELPKFSEDCIQCCINAGANEAQISRMRDVHLKIKNIQ